MRRYISNSHMDLFVPGDDITDAYPQNELDRHVANGYAYIETVTVSVHEAAGEVALEELTVKELRVLAVQAEIPGYSSMRKVELINALRDS